MFSAELSYLLQMSNMVCHRSSDLEEEEQEHSFWSNFGGLFEALQKAFLPVAIFLEQYLFLYQASAGENMKRKDEEGAQEKSWKCNCELNTKQNLAADEKNNAVWQSILGLFFCKKDKK